MMRSILIMVGSSVSTQAIPFRISKGISEVFIIHNLRINHHLLVLNGALFWLRITSESRWTRGAHTTSRYLEETSAG